MIEIVLNFLHSSYGIKIPAVFFYTSTRMVLAAITALLISIALGPWFIRKLYALKIGQTIRTDECPPLAQLHANKKNTPTMGGILILFALFISLLLWMDLTHVFTWILGFSLLAFGLIGGIDDFLKLRYKNAKGLSGKKKLLGQFLISLLIALYLFIPGVSLFVHKNIGFSPPVIKEEQASAFSSSDVRESPHSKRLSLQEYASRIYVPFLKEPLWKPSAWWILYPFLFSLFVIIGSSNAVNLTDGLDGLASGCLLLVAVSLALIAFLSNNIDLSGYLNILYIEGSGEIAVFLAGFAGACLGFLWYNGYPAQVFMGDTGSLALGGLIGISAVLLKREFLLAIVGGIFVVEALSVIIQVGSFRLRNKKRIFLCAPLHHHFEYKGWHEMKVVIRFWIIALLLALIGLASLKFQ